MPTVGDHGAAPSSPISLPWHTAGLHAAGSDGGRTTITSQPHPGASQRYLG